MHIKYWGVLWGVIYGGSCDEVWLVWGNGDLYPEILTRYLIYKVLN